MGNLWSRKRRLNPSLPSLPDKITFEELENISTDFIVSEFEFAKRPLLVTNQMKEIYESIVDSTSRSVGGSTLNLLQGPSGVGKTMTLLVIGHIARKWGCLVFPLRAGDFCGEDVDLNYQAFLQLLRWRAACGDQMLSQVQCPCTSSQSLLDLVRLAEENRTRSLQILCDLLENLRATSQVPVVLLLDQYNAFPQYQAPALPSVEPTSRDRFLKIFSNPEHLVLSRGGIFCAFSFSSRLLPRLRDENSLLCTQMYPLNKRTFEAFIKTVRPGLVAPSDLNGDLNEFIQNLFDLCQGLPREASSFLKLMTMMPAGTWSQWQHSYFEEREAFYACRLQTLFKKVEDDVNYKDTLMFAAQIFVGNRTGAAPLFWKQIGLVVPGQRGDELPCPAAERGFLLAFTEDTTKNAIEIFQSDSSIRWRALELGVVYVARLCVAAANPLDFECTDLCGGNGHTVRVHIFNIQHSVSQPRANSLRRGTLFVWPARHPVIDFFVYGNDGTKILLQVSESPYQDHPLKYEDLNRSGVKATYDAAVEQRDKNKAPTYIYMTTSAVVMKMDGQGRPSSKFYQEQVRLVSNFDGKTRAFFRNLIQW